MRSRDPLAGKIELVGYYQRLDQSGIHSYSPAAAVAVVAVVEVHVLLLLRLVVAKIRTRDIS